MGNIYKQFTVGCIREGTIVSIERWIDTDDGGEPFAYTQLFPKERQFKDPDSVGKQICNRFGEKRKCYLLDTLFDDPATLEKVRIAYEGGRLLSDIVLYDIACRYGSDAQYIACSKSVYSKGKKSFPPRESRVNYEELTPCSASACTVFLFSYFTERRKTHESRSYSVSRVPGMFSVPGS